MASLIYFTMGHGGVVCLIWCSILLLTAAGPVSAGFTMTVKVTQPSFGEGDTATMGVELVNSGDETAYKGTLEIAHPPGLTSRPISYETIEPNITYKREVEVAKEPDMLPGSYPLVLSLRFHDSNNYPIYMIFDSALVIGEQSASGVHGELSNVNLPTDGSRELTLKIKNADDETHKVKAKIILPGGLKADKTEETVEVEPQAEASVDYTISNFMALPGSDLLVIAAIEYDEDQRHYSTLAKARVRLEQKSERPMFLLMAFIVVVLLGAYYHLELWK